jgi:hypothetical protein
MGTLRRSGTARHLIYLDQRPFVEDGQPLELHRFRCSCGKTGLWHDTVAIAVRYGERHLQAVRRG